MGMFGYVLANYQELSKDQRSRYGAAYCGICRRIQAQSGLAARLGLSYDMAFLALLLMSLYEPEEDSGKNACLIHPITRRIWLDSPYIRYAADMNVALSYYHLLDDWEDEGKRRAKYLSDLYAKYLPDIQARYPRQCEAIAAAIRELSDLERSGCANPDEPAAAFGRLMGELLTYEEDLWADNLRQMGMALGRFIYLLDAALDYDKDKKKDCYNPYLAMGAEKDWDTWEQYLVNIMGRCTDHYERLPLVQDKGLLDNILYSGIWINYRRKRKEEDQT